MLVDENNPGFKEVSKESDDCVSRQAVLDAIKEWTSYMFTTPTGDLIKTIKQLPPVTPAEKVGFWILNDEDLKISNYTCAKCKGLSDMDSDYCPKCGAKMWR